MSKQRQVKGLQKELQKSLEIHRDGLPVLVSSSFLRSYGAGQVDLASLRGKNEKILYLYEVKSSGSASFGQLQRIRKSAKLLSSLLDVSCRILII